MTYDGTIENVVRVVEGAGAAILVVGGLVAFARCMAGVRSAGGRTGAYERLRHDLGRVILLGLEVLIIADIILTIAIEPTAESVVVLGGIVLIRIILSVSLEVEIDGSWPWARARRTGAQGR